MIILPNRKKLMILRILASIAEAFTELSGYVPDDKFAVLYKVVLDGIADIASIVGGIEGLEEVVAHFFGDQKGEPT